MSGRNNSYDWAAYYAAAYEKERKQNIVLAGKIADAERRQADYSDNLNRICSNPFWKMTSPVRKLYHGVKEGARFRENADRSSGESTCLLHYTEEVEKQKNRYREWINNTCNNKMEQALPESFKILGWTEKEVDDTDVIIIAYGTGWLDSNSFLEIKSRFNDEKSCMIAYGDEDFYVG